MSDTRAKLLKYYSAVILTEPSKFHGLIHEHPGLKLMVGLLSPRAKPISVSGIQVEPFITIINIYHIYHKRQLSQDRLRYRILSIPDGYYLFRTDIFSSGRVFFIPSGCRTSEAFQVYLYSYAVPQC